MIELRQVTKKFGSRTALEALDLIVPKGEIYGLLGQNGAGKSTAIGIMLGQVWPTSGQVRLLGHDVFRRRQQALLKVGAIFESPVFYDYLTGWRNLEIFTCYSGGASKKRMAEVVEWVGLKGEEHRKVKTYSHGMRARLALAQALLPGPELLILDEPGDGLDPEGIHEMRNTILRLRRELGLTILFSSHLLPEVEQLCTRIAVLNKGRKIFEGTVAQARQFGQWFRLETSDFERAAALLRAAGLVKAVRDGRLIAPADGAGSDRIAKYLVENGLPVFELARHEETLETFYMSLMRRDRSA